MYKGNKICSFEDLIHSYDNLGNVWKVAEMYNVSGQVVHNTLSKLNIIKKMNYFTQVDINFLKKNYHEYRKNGNLKLLAKMMGRRDTFISRKAKELGLTDRNNRISMKYMSDKISENTKKFISKNGHPRGMYGKKHTEEAKLKFSERNKKLWSDPKSKFNSDEFRQNRSDTMSKIMSEKMKNNSINNYNRVKRGHVSIGGKSFFARSSWECNIGAYLEFLKQNNKIKDWEHEADTFWFEKIKRGIRSYLPDFKVFNIEGDVYYIEVKGWMDKKSMTKLNRMKLYHPNTKIEVIDSHVYKSIKKWSSVIKDWGLLDSDNNLQKIKKCSLDTCELKHFSKNYCRKHFYEFVTKKNK